NGGVVVRRVVGIAVAFLVGLGLVYWWSLRAFREPAMATGSKLYSDRALLTALITRQHSDRPLLVWMGDSTIISLKQQSYPQLIADSMARTMTLETRIVADVGLDPYHYFFLMGQVLELHPDMVVILAHARTFSQRSGNRNFNDLASMIPVSELPTAVQLPLYERGLTVPGLLLMRTLRWPGATDSLLFFDGARSMFREAKFWDWLGPQNADT